MASFHINNRLLTLLLFISSSVVSCLSSSYAQPPIARRIRNEHWPRRARVGVSASGSAALQTQVIGGNSADMSGVLEYTVTKMREIPHVGKPWTQGLEFTEDEKLLESSGDYPPGSGSFLRLVDPQTGSTLDTITKGLSQNRFVEGISKLGDSWFASTYMDKIALEYDSEFQNVKEHHFPWQGWGLTRDPDGKSFIATNSSEYLLYLEPGTFAAKDVKIATCVGKRVAGLNELEMVDDFMGQGPRLLANLINTRMVLILDPQTAHCTGAFDLSNLESIDDKEVLGFHVANGIAYNRHTGTFMVTGKNWEHMYEVKLTKSTMPVNGQSLGGASVLAALQRHLTQIGSLSA